MKKQRHTPVPRPHPPSLTSIPLLASSVASGDRCRGRLLSGNAAVAVDATVSVPDGLLLRAAAAVGSSGGLLAPAAAPGLMLIGENAASSAATYMAQIEIVNASAGT